MCDESILERTVEVFNWQHRDTWMGYVTLARTHGLILSRNEDFFEYREDMSVIARQQRFESYASSAKENWRVFLKTMPERMHRWESNTITLIYVS